MKLVIVESPAKAQTINKYLGSDYKVVASIGHIRDLSRTAKEKAVLPDNDFEIIWEQKTVQKVLLFITHKKFFLNVPQMSQNLLFKNILPQF